MADAVKSADVVMILLPDEQIASVYKNEVEPQLLARAIRYALERGRTIEALRLADAMQARTDAKP